jgi:hypothetical protein
MAAYNHIATKMVFEYVDPETSKKTRYTFPYIKETITETAFLAAAVSIDTLRNPDYTNLYRTDEAEIFAD